MNTITMQKSIIRVVVVTTAILLIPLIAMQFTEEVAWTLGDFVVAGVLLLGTGFMLDLAMRKMGRYRVAAAATIVVLFLWLWAELAVGIFTNWGS